MGTKLISDWVFFYDLKLKVKSTFGAAAFSAALAKSGMLLL